jgi:hypothetical protein
MTFATDRATQVRKYFTKMPEKPETPNYSKHQVKMGLGSGLMFVGLILLFSGEGIPILLGIAAEYFGFKFLKKGFSEYSKVKKKYKADYKQYEKDYEKAMPKPSDEQIDKWMNDDIAKIIEEALRRLDLDHGDYRANPLIIGGPTQSKKNKYATGQDGKVRYSYFDILIVFLTDYHVASYHCSNSMELGQSETDNTQEFPYKEITNLGTQTVKELIYFAGDDAVSEKGFQKFILATSGANIIQVAYAFSRNNIDLELKTIGEEKTIAAIRKKLQDYKQKYER